MDCGSRRKLLMAIYYPPVFINKYIQEKLALKGFGAIPIFPTYPNDFSVATDFVLDVSVNNSVQRYSFGGQVGVYDRMMKKRQMAFPHIKCEQALYYFYAIQESAVINILEISQVIQDLFDGSDESAQELNSWIRDKASGTVTIDGKEYKKVTFDNKDFLIPFFHYTNVYQLEETRDAITTNSVRTYAGVKLILDYDWHKS